MKGISIIIPCFNYGEFLEENVLSIISQPHKNPFEIIIVNDFSTDIATMKVLEKIKNFENVKIVNLEKNCGTQVARNTGIKNAKYDFILMMDADDRLNTSSEVLKNGSFLDLAIDILEDDSIAFVHGINEMFGEYDGPTISPYPTSEELIMHKHHAQICIIYRITDAINGYNEKIDKWQDWSFAVGLLNGRLNRNLENKIKFIPKPFYQYRIHTKTDRISAREISEYEMTLITIKSYPEIFEKYYPGNSPEETAKIVVGNKPTKLVDLLYIAKDDIERALEMVRRRGFVMTATNEIVGIP